jgi:hypothetical protein
MPLPLTEVGGLPRGRIVAEKTRRAHFPDGGASTSAGMPRGVSLGVRELPFTLVTGAPKIGVAARAKRSLAGLKNMLEGLE